MSHLVHGLDTEAVPPDWLPLTLAEVRSVFAGYALAAPTAVLWRSPRPLSAAALVASCGRRLFVKRHHRTVRTPTTLSEEHRFIAHLCRQGIPVPEVLTDSNGDTAHARDAWTYEVHACARGTDVYRDHVSWSPLTRLDHARAAGAMLARLHRASASYVAPQRQTQLLVARDDLIRARDPITTLATQLPMRPGLAAYLAERDWHGDIERLISPRHALLQPRLASQPRLWAHNDWHASNLCWDDAAENPISDVLDFGLAAPTSALFDLATAIERNAIDWLKLERDDDAVHIDTASALIDGYCGVRVLSSSDLHTLALLLPLVHVDFALSEVEYFHAVTGSQTHADIAYETFLLGHAGWFDSAPAQRLLEIIHHHE